MISKIKFRIKTPTRTCSKKFTKYTKYKSFLKNDFNSNCGYCDVPDNIMGGIRFFTVEHFAPKTKFPHKTFDYSNLIYCCHYCNTNKGDDWISTKADISVVKGKGYIDPCDIKYDRAFFRDSFGKIYPKTKVAKYMYLKMQLFLKRHSLIWMMSKQKSLIEKYKKQVILSPKRNLAIKLTSVLTEYDRIFTEYLGIISNV